MEEPVNQNFDGPEKRWHERYPLSFPIRYGKAGSGDFQNGFCSDICLSGLRFITSKAFSQNDHLQIQIISPEEGDKGDLLVEALVIWTRAGGESGGDGKEFVVGVQFFILTEKQFEELEQFLFKYCQAGQNTGEQK